MLNLRTLWRKMCVINSLNLATEKKRPFDFFYLSKSVLIWSVLLEPINLVPSA